jgi:hypothetical protein
MHLVEIMKDHFDRRVRVWARAAEERLKQDIAHWDSIDRERDSQFE